MPAQAPQWGPALAQFGIVLDNPCDVGALTDMIADETKAFIEEATEEIQKLSAEGGGAMFLALMVIILENVLNMGTGVALAYGNQLMAQMMGGSIGTMYAGVALALTSLDGLQLIIAYLGAVALRNALIKHNEISRVIDADVKILIIFIQNLIEFFSPKQKVSEEYLGLRIAMEELKVAAQLLGIEYGKVTSGGAAVSRANIESAKSRVDRSLNALTGGTFSGFDQHFSDAINEALPNSASTVLDFSGDATNSWEPVLARLQSAVETEMFSGLSFSMDGDEFDQALGQRLNTLEQMTGKIFPLLPEFAQLIFVQLFVGNSINRLLARVPVLAGILGGFTEWMTARLDPPQEVRDLIPPEPAILDTPPIIQDDPKITYKRATTAVKTFEAALLLAPSYFNFIKGMAGIAAGILQPSISTINQVKSEMKQTDQELRTQQIGTISMSGRKIKWGSKLVQVNAILSALSPTVVVEDEIDIQELLAATQTAETALTDLKEFIKTQNLTSSGTARTKPAEDVHEVSQKYLSPLAASQLVLLSPSVAARTLAGSQAIALLLRKQRGENVALLQRVNVFINSVENLPTFTSMKSLYDQILASLGGGPFGDLANSLANGDLSDLASQLDTISAIGDIAELGLCIADLEKPSLDTPAFLGELSIPELPGMPDPNWSPELENAKVTKWERWKEDSAQTISNLKDKKQALESKIDLANKVIDWVSAFSGAGV